jgi:drug/metabolite transporter (DMT)-like permease
MFLAFIPWNRGLAIGGIARIAQVQLAQPVLTLLWSVLLLGERVGARTVAAALLVLASVAATQRAGARGTSGTAGRIAAADGRLMESRTSRRAR